MIEDMFDYTILENPHPFEIIYHDATLLKEITARNIDGARVVLEPGRSFEKVCLYVNKDSFIMMENVATYEAYYVYVKALPIEKRNRYQRTA